MVHLTSGYLNLADLDTVQSIRAAAAGGVGELGLRLTGHRPGDPGPEVVGRPQNIAALNQALDDAGISLANIST